MIIRYKFKLRNPLIFDDFWPIPIMNGKLHAMDNDGKITGFMAEFKGQDPDFSPSLLQCADGEVKAHIVGRDKLVSFAQVQIQNALSFLQCYFDLEIMSDEVNTEYIAESDEEKKKISIMSLNIEKSESTPTIPFDMFARAVMASEKYPSPVLEASF